MIKLLLLVCLILCSPAYAGSAILNLSGTNNVLNLSQTADSNVMFNAPDPNTTNNVYSIKQAGGGDHTANVDIEGNFQNYNFYLSQNSSQNLSITIQQTCNNPVCSPSSPYLFNQY